MAVRPFLRIQGREAGILEGGGTGHAPDVLPERLPAHHVADAAPQVAVLVQGHEGAQGLGQRPSGQRGRQGRRDVLPALKGRGDAFPGQPGEPLPFFVIEGKADAHDRPP